MLNAGDNRALPQLRHLSVCGGHQVFYLVVRDTIAARRGTPLAIGIVRERCFSSDASFLAQLTKKLFIWKMEIGQITSAEQYFMTKMTTDRPICLTELSGEAVKGGYRHFMLKEYLRTAASYR